MNLGRRELDETAYLDVNVELATSLLLCQSARGHSPLRTSAGVVAEGNPTAFICKKGRQLIEGRKRKG